jgi:hypothetical protein
MYNEGRTILCKICPPQAGKSFAFLGQLSYPKPTRNCPIRKAKSAAKKLPFLRQK